MLTNLIDLHIIIKHNVKSFDQEVVADMIILTESFRLVKWKQDI